MSNAEKFKSVFGLYATEMWSSSEAQFLDWLNADYTDEGTDKIGHWVWDENGMDWNLGAWRCSECGRKAETWWASSEKLNPLRCSGSNFCGVCGARMVKGE